MIKTEHKKGAENGAESAQKVQRKCTERMQNGYRKGAERVQK